MRVELSFHSLQVREKGGRKRKVKEEKRRRRSRGFEEKYQRNHHFLR
jgi:hypothetical protein